MVTVAAWLARALVGRSPDLEEVELPEHDDAECSEEFAVVVKTRARALAEGARLAINQRDLANHVRLAEWSRTDLRSQCQYGHRRLQDHWSYYRSQRPNNLKAYLAAEVGQDRPFGLVVLAGECDPI